MAITNLATAATAPVNYQLMEGLLSAAKKKLPMFNGTVPGNLSMNQGAPAVTWQRINNLDVTTTALGEKETASATAWQNGRTPVVAAVSVVTSTPLKYGNFIHLTEEVDLIQMNVRAMKYMDTLGANAGESLNELMIDVYQSGSTTRQGTAAASDLVTGAAVTVNDIKYALNQLNRNSAQPFLGLADGSTSIDTKTLRESYYGICHSDSEEDIRGLTGFVGVEQYAGYTSTMPGEFGHLGGVRWSSTPLAGLIEASAGASSNTMRYTASVGACDIYSSFIYGQDAIGSVGLGQNHTTSSHKMYDTIPAVQVIQHGKGSAGAGDPMDEMITLAWKAWFSGAGLQPLWCYELRTCSTIIT